MRKILVLLEMIKIQHSLFALPFAAAAAIVAAEGKWLPREYGLILAAMVTARAAAMAFNRWADAGIDAENPRTVGRAIPKGDVSRGGAMLFTVVCSAAFIGSAALLNRLTLMLSPVALVIILFYSFTKRFTALCHFFLGLSLAIAPVGAWLAIRPGWDPLPWLLGAGVLLWTSGFDILYACMDVEFDRRKGLHSVPVALGVPGALRVAAVLHALTLVAFAAPIFVCGFGAWYGVGLGAIALLLAYEHLIVRPDDLARVNRAFFHVNAVVSFGMMAAVLADYFVRGSRL
ncbi:MAG: UbiA-like polyprenyltransferase [Planctomycetota bacterium]